MRTWQRTKDTFLIILMALLLALSYHILIYPNDFAPAGFPVFATMLQDLFYF